jgi:hypothetical protein
MFWRPAHELRGSRKAWWDTKLARHYGADGLAARLWLKHFYPRLIGLAANDMDHVRW